MPLTVFSRISKTEGVNGQALCNSALPQNKILISYQ